MKKLIMDQGNGWQLKVTYRKSMHDLIIEQNNKKMKVNRFVYFHNQNMTSVSKLMDFLNSLPNMKRGKCCRNSKN